MEITELYRIAVACQTLGLVRSTVRSAIERGEIPVYKTGCDLPMVKLSDLKKWAKQERVRGPKPAAR